uniref:Nitrilase 1 n=1 Tax=Pseudonaja textilis TaxID=8673 RepID=A0A670ZHM6_PSETE
MGAPQVRSSFRVTPRNLKLATCSTRSPSISRVGGLICSFYIVHYQFLGLIGDEDQVMVSTPRKQPLVHLISVGRFIPSRRRVPPLLYPLPVSGCVAAAYRKIHLFDVELEGRVSLKESAFTNPGSEMAPPVPTPAGKVGLAICYDLRFPEMALTLAQAGAEILTYPSAFTVTTGAAHWEVLLRARAVETQSYVVAAAQTGQHHPSRSSFGHSMVVDPWGSIVAQCREGPGLCFAEIDLPYLHRLRQEMPVFAHRRPRFYSRAAAEWGLGLP